MAITTEKDLSKVKTLNRLKFCTSCNQYNYHIYYVDYPARVFICQVCKNEVRSYSSK